MADKAEKTAADKADAARDKARADELSIQEQIVKAVEGISRDKDGTPKPIVIPEG